MTIEIRDQLRARDYIEYCPEGGDSYPVVGYKEAQDRTKIICYVCGLPIVGQDYDNRHWWHEPDCPNASLAEGDEMVECDCDIETHDYCVPDWIER